MSEVTLVAESGRTIGSRSSGRLREDGRIPAVVYGHGITPLSVSIDRKDLRHALHTDAGHNAVINLEVGSDKHLTIVKDMQRHPVRNEVIHVDFLVVNRNEIVTVDVPIILEGESQAVHNADGTIDQQLFSLSVNTTPTNIPNDITVDVSSLGIGDSIRVGDLKLPEGVTTDVDPEEAVAIAQVTRATIEAEQLETEAEEAAEAADAEDETAEGEAGETAAAEGDAEEASE
ncbi:MAG: rplY [Actinomycetia bacterium]|jgi:large subunit ribosomal protein L25|nr:rplY [Actinomycetes bacterium]